MISKINYIPVQLTPPLVTTTPPLFTIPQTQTQTQTQTPPISIYTT